LVVFITTLCTCCIPFLSGFYTFAWLLIKFMFPGFLYSLLSIIFSFA
jgi:hypothetical protein